MRSDLRKVIYDSIKSQFAGKVIWAAQNAPRPAGPFAVLKVLSNRDVGMESVRARNAQGNASLTSQRECTVRVEVLGTDAYDNAESIRDNLFKGAVRYKFLRVQAVLRDASLVLDTAYLMSEIHIGERAVFDMMVRYTTTVVEPEELIEHVDTTGSVLVNVDEKVVEHIDLVINKPGT